MLFDEVYPKAFWVTFRLKADFKEFGKVDGLLKMRYLVYRLLWGREVGLGLPK